MGHRALVVQLEGTDGLATRKEHGLGVDRGQGSAVLDETEDLNPGGLALFGRNGRVTLFPT